MRQRPDDILPIARHTMDERYELSGDAFEALALHPWRFNVRELINVIRKAMVRLPDGGRLQLCHLEPDVTLPNAPDNPTPALPPEGSEPTRGELEQLLSHYDGKIAQVARHTGKGRNQVYRWLERYALNASQYRK